MLISCTHLSTSDFIIKKYTQVNGTLSSFDKDDKNRLFIYVITENGLVTGLLDNKDESSIIPELSDSLHGYPTDKEIIFYGQKTSGFEEILDGIDYEVIGLKFYQKKSQRFIFVQVNYKKTAKEAIRNISFKTIFKICFDLVQKLI